MRTAVLARLCILCLLGASGGSHAQDVSVLGGQLKVNEKDERSFAAALNYFQPAGQYTALSLTYLNEGHPENHHRDGVGAQAWLRTQTVEQGLAFGVGAGQYYYFDTARTTSGDYSNNHGWANLVSASATWHTPGRWYGQVQASRVFPRDKDATTSLLVGIGYRFDGVRGDKLHLDGPSTDDTLTLSLGQTIVNSFNSERSRGSSLEYRSAIAPYIDWTVSALKEGTSARTHRSGVATQLWLIRSLNPSVEIGMGVGPYAALDLHDVDVRQSHLAGLVSIALRYHLNKRLVSQLIWNRVVTDYHRDSDMLQLGLGASF